MWAPNKQFNESLKYKYHEVMFQEKMERMK